MKADERFPNDSVETHTPVTFSIAFVARMRRSAGLSHVPSLRTTLAVPRFLTARYFRTGALNPADYVDAAVLNTPYEDQETARRLATEILFPPEKKRKAETEKGESTNGDAAGATADPSDPLAGLMDDLASLNLDLDDLDDLGDALNDIADIDDALGAYDVYDSLFSGDPADRMLGELVTMLGGPGELEARGVRTRADLVAVTGDLLEQRIGALTPEMVRHACATGYGETLTKRCQHPWETVATLAALQRYEDLDDFVADARRTLDVRSLGKMMMFLGPYA